MRLQVESRRPIAQVGLTPLIDVVFILLLFFMLATNFESWRSMQIEAPNPGGTATVASQRALLVRVLEDGVEVGGQRGNMDGLGEMIRSRLDGIDGAADVVVSAADGVPLQQIVTAIDTIESTGIRRLRLSVQ